jgi:SAM-dependent methyltransferase
MNDALRDKTIRDFGEQWQAYQNNDGYYASRELIEDIISPFLLPEELKGARVADIGSGAGRIVMMLLAAGVQHVLAVEPSEAYEVLVKNLDDRQEAVTFLRARGDEVPPSGDLDYVFSIGVLHHIPHPLPVVRAAYQALKPGGKIIVWLYGQEGNRLYLALSSSLRLVTVRMPHWLLAALVRVLDPPLVLYMKACRRLPLPLRHYMTKVMGRLDGKARRLVIYDQLNPAWAKYYTRAEALALLRDGGFKSVAAHHRHGYSWTVVGTREDVAGEGSSDHGPV